MYENKILSFSDLSIEKKNVLRGFIYTHPPLLWGKIWQSSEQ